MVLTLPGEPRGRPGIFCRLKPMYPDFGWVTFIHSYNTVLQMGNHTLTLTRDIATLCYLRRIVLLCLPSPGVDLEKFRVCIQMSSSSLFCFWGEKVCWLPERWELWDNPVISQGSAAGLKKHPVNEHTVIAPCLVLRAPRCHYGYSYIFSTAWYNTIISFLNNDLKSGRGFAANPLSIVPQSLVF